MNKKLCKTEIQLQLFEEALARLLRNEGKYVTPGKKLSMARLAKEAAVGSGTLYYKPYSEFRIRAAESISRYNSGTTQVRATNTSNHEMLESLRNERDNERRLKIQYRKSCRELKAQRQRLCAERGATEHALYQAMLRIAELEQKFEKITGIHPDNYVTGSSSNIAFLPRDLQKVK
ncbi:hypothetical protein I7V28_06040 [Lelliottia amnigena]|jgi:hypothetical protein|uniref:hypothetical protein n=1 Tax=Lelliottia TaxID=1330545 RepID=UPI00192C4B9A|nr:MULTISPECIES: hypothetical protein [Lelliottia]EKD5635403.1 hypothetical protein [Escherichia coli]MBL5884921.1 hypothetical protein [Lelliottia aquatilis]MBL5920680.1 hypothetical protein [Lelliottia amnigena]MBL5932753.1 hypothetical protein [Lelliottia amnigena]